jgi:integrase
MAKKLIRIEKDYYRPTNRKFNKLKDRRWRVVYPSPTSLGVRKETYRTEREAVARVEFLSQISIKDLSYEKWSVEDAATFWETTRLCKLRSYERELSRIRAIKRILGHIRLNELTEDEIGRFKASLGDGSTVRTLNSYLVTLRTILNHCRKKGIVRVVPDVSDYIETSLEVKRERVLTKDEFESLLQACHVKKSGRDRKHLIPYLLWLHELGCPTGELAQIKAKDIELTRGVVRIWSGKAKRPVQRECGISLRLRTIISEMELEKKSPDGHVFSQQSRWQRSFSTACRIAGIQNLRLHDLRRTAITNMLEKGIPLNLVAKMVGHSAGSVLTLDVYTRFRSDFIREMMSRMD